MKKLIAAVLLFVVLTPVSCAQKNGPDIYDPSANIGALIDSNLTVAKQQNKHLLLMFGGNWCPWCHRLHGLFESDPKIRSLLQESYILILVDIGETADKPLNRDLLKKYRAEGFGYPALAVLDQEGKLLSAQSTGVLEKGKGHDPEKVAAFLEAEKPQK